MNNKLYTFVSLLLLSGGAFASAVPETQNLRSLVDYALANNPEVNVARERHIGALARVPQAMALPEPKLTYR